MNLFIFSVFPWIKIQQGRGEIFPGVGKKLWNHHDCQKCQFLMHFIWLLEPRRTECHLIPWCWWKSKSLSSFEKMHWSWSWVFLAKFFFGDGMNLAEDFFFLPPSFWRWIRDRLEEGKISFCQTKLKRSRDDQRLLLQHHRSLCSKEFFFEFNLVIIIALLLMFRSVNFKSIVQGRGK